MADNSANTGPETGPKINRVVPKDVSELPGIEMHVIDAVCSHSPYQWFTQTLSKASFIIDATTSAAYDLPLSCLNQWAREIGDNKSGATYLHHDLVVDFIGMFLLINAKRVKSSISNAGSKALTVRFGHISPKPHRNERLIADRWLLLNNFHALEAKRSERNQVGDATL